MHNFDKLLQESTGHVWRDAHFEGRVVKNCGYTIESYSDVSLGKGVQSAVYFALLPIVDDRLDITRPHLVDGFEPSTFFHELADQLYLLKLFLLGSIAHESRNIHDGGVFQCIVLHRHLIIQVIIPLESFM